MPRHFRTMLAAILVGGVYLVSGCSATPTPHNSSNEVRNPAVWGQHTRGHDVSDISTHIFGIEGVVKEVFTQARIVRTIDVAVIRNLVTAVGYDPMIPGDEVKIRLDEESARLKGLNLKTGSMIMICFGGIDYSGDWGSNAGWIAVERNGGFYNASGQKVDENNLFP